MVGWVRWPPGYTGSRTTTSTMPPGSPRPLATFASFAVPFIKGDEDRFTWGEDRPATMTSYELTVEHVEDHVMRTETPSGHEVVMDSKPEPGGEGATPVEMLLASAGACSLIDVASILEKKRLDFHDLTVRVEGERREEQPRRFTELNLVYEVEGDVPEKALQQACELSVETYCSVLDTIRSAPAVSWEARVGSA